MSPPPQNKSTSTTDGKGTGTGWALAMLVSKKRPAVSAVQEALLHARSLKLKSERAWRAWRMTGARPANTPSTPHAVYKHEGWQGYGHWLGTGNFIGGKQGFLPFKEALLYARALKLKTQKEWLACKSGARPANVPSRPDLTYQHDGWQGYGHWLGTGNVRGDKAKAVMPL